MKRREELVRKVNMRLEKERFEREHMPLPQDQLIQPADQAYFQAKQSQNMRETYELRGFKPAWRPLVTNHCASLQLATCSQTIRHQRNFCQLTRQEVPLRGSSYEHPNFLSNILHTVKEDLTIELPTSPASISEFLFNLAVDLCEGGIRQELHEKSMKAAYDSTRLTHLEDEFFVICLLNIFYGDPRLPIYRMHPIVSGLTQQDVTLANLKAKLGAYQSRSTLDHRQLQKNSLLQLTLLMTKLQHPIELQNKIKSQDQAVKSAIDLLQNGEITRAARCFSVHRMNKMALLVSQICQGNQQVKEQIIHSALQSKVAGQNMGVFFEIVTGKRTQGSWLQKLTQSLMFAEPTADLIAILKHFLSQNESNDVFLVMIKSHLELLDGTYDVYMGKLGQPEDLFGQWIVHLVQKMFVCSQNGQSHPALDELTVKLVQQLLREHGNNKQLHKALTLCLFIEEPALKQHTLLQTVIEIERLMRPSNAESKLSLDEFIHSVLRLSRDYAEFAVSQRMLAEQDYASVILTYLKLDQSESLQLDLAQEAHNLFCEQLASRFFGSLESINELLWQHISFDMGSKAKQADIPSGFRNTATRRLLDQLLSSLSQKVKFIKDWGSGGLVFMESLEVLDGWQKVIASHKQVFDRELQQITSAQCQSLLKKIMCQLPSVSSEVANTFKMLLNYLRQVDDQLSVLVSLNKE